MKSALIVWGGWDGHQPQKSIEIFTPFLREQGYQLDISDTLDPFLNAEKLKTYSLIIPCWTMGALTGDQEKNLTDAIASGVGLAGWHGGMGDAFRNNALYQFMVGGQFVAHPGNIINYTVQITRPEDPIVKGLKAFAMKSEQYFMHVDPSNEVIVHTITDGTDAPWVKGTVMPVAWKRKWAEGRVFYSALGHTPEDLQVPEAFEMMKRGMLWASRG